jgi:hypothetical protein
VEFHLPVKVTFRILSLVAIFCIASSMQSAGKVRAVSTDGEATVYLLHDFSRAFDLKYSVWFKPSPRNRSWSDVSVLLIGRSPSAGSVSVGLMRGYPNAGTLSALTMATRPGVRPAFKSIPVHCAHACAIELRGDARNVEALVQGRAVGVWMRADLALIKPYVQINGEVSATGDRIAAQMRPIHVVLSGRAIPHPKCAFTTQGVEPHRGRDGTIVFSGARRVNGRATFISLVNGKDVGHCPR